MAFSVPSSVPSVQSSWRSENSGYPATRSRSVQAKTKKKIKIPTAINSRFVRVLCSLYTLTYLLLMILTEREGQVALLPPLLPLPPYPVSSFRALSLSLN